jgi:hypothetical protein
LIYAVEILVELLAQKKNSFILFILLANLETVFNGVAASFGNDIFFDYFQYTLRSQLASQSQMKLKNVEEFLGLNWIDTLMNVLQDDIFDILLLES